MLDCDGFDHGCAGGDIKSAFEFLERSGIHTAQCNPFVSYNATFLNECMDDDKCVDGDDTKFKCKKDSLKIFESPEAVKQEILKSGPVTTFFMAYTDLLYYKSGVYQHTKGDFGGGHAVKIIGWGETWLDNYWIIANSWGPDWGMDGYFWMKQGDSAVDKFVVSCEPEV